MKRLEPLTGFPANGKPVPTGAMMAQIESLNARNPAAQRDVIEDINTDPGIEAFSFTFG